MSRIFGRIILTLSCTILLATAAQARTLKEVYLKDGGRIECQKVWQANGKVMVLINRDTLLDLPRSDVDLKKTFARKPAKTAKKRMPAMKAQSEPAATKTAVAEPPPAKSPVATTAEPKPAAPTKPAAPGPANTPHATVKQAVQQVATSARKQVPGATVTPEGPRAKLPLAPPPEPQKSFLSGNMATIGLIVLLVVLVIGLVLFKKKQQG